MVLNFFIVQEISFDMMIFFRNRLYDHLACLALYEQCIEVRQQKVKMLCIRHYMNEYCHMFLHGGN